VIRNEVCDWGQNAIRLQEHLQVIEAVQRHEFAHPVPVGESSHVFEAPIGCSTKS
jgi:hypothetical protein